MAHPSVGSTPHPSHSHPGMDTVPNPSLHRAIGGLMVNLDDELSRYRHSRTGQGPRPQPQRQFILRAKERTALSLPPRPPKAPPTQAQKNSPRTAPSTAMAQGADSLGLPPFPSPTGQALAPYVAMPEAYLESTAALLGSSDPGLAAGAADPATSQAATPSSAPYYPTRYYPEPSPSLDPDNYQPSLAQRLSTPLGVGALLLLLVSSAGFGYLITSPTAIAHLRNQPWMAVFQPASAPDADNGEAPAPSDVPTGLQGLGPDLSGQSPEALSLDQVSRLPVEPARSGAMAPSTVTTPVEDGPNADSSRSAQPPAATANSTPAADNTRPQAPEPTQPPSPLRTETVAPPTTSRSTPTTVSPSAVNPGSSRPVSQAPRPVSPPSPPTPTAQPPQPLGTVTTAPTPMPAAPPPPLAPSATTPAPRTNYYVVTDYTGQQSLDSARSVVGDAYVRNFQGGSKIQMGAFSQESSARDLMQELQQRGIPAQVYNSP